MRLAHALLVLVDISGYTRFITRRTTSLLHAEQIVTELLASVIDKAEYPLVLNKLQGDAALLWREYAPGDAADALQGALVQIGGFFSAFAACRQRLAQQRGNCPCEACRGTANLTLKAFVHCGEIAIKQVRQFEELAGEPLIFIHRLLKNHVDLREYVLLSDEARRLAPGALPAAKPQREHLEGLGEAELWLTTPGSLPAQFRGTAAKAKAAAPAPAAREPHFRNLPHIGGPEGWWISLKRRLSS